MVVGLVGCLAPAASALLSLLASELHPAVRRQRAEARLEAARAAAASEAPGRGLGAGGGPGRFGQGLCSCGPPPWGPRRLDSLVPGVPPQSPMSQRCSPPSSLAFDRSPRCSRPSLGPALGRPECVRAAIAR